MKSLKLALLVSLAAGSVQAQSSNVLIPLLTNASSSGSLNAGLYGGNYQINLAGTVGGSTVTLTESDSAGVQQTVATFTAVGNQCIAIGAKQSIQAVVTGGSPSGLYMTAQGVQACPPGSSGGASQNVNIAGVNGAAPSLTNPIWTAFAEAGDTTGTFTNATQTTSVTANNGDGYGTALVSINGTYGTATAVFEVSDDNGTTWYPAIATRSDNTASETGYTTLTNTNRQWQIALGGNDSVRVRSTAVASGTVNVRISVVAQPNAVTVNGSVNATLPSGTTTIVTQATAANLNAQVVGAETAGSAVTGLGLRAMGSDGTNARDLLTDSSGHLITNLTVFSTASSSFVNLSSDGGRLYSVPAPSGQSIVANTPSVTSAVGSSLVLKASAGNLYGWRVTTGASAGYVLVFNATSLPANGAVTPVDCVAVAANSTVGAGPFDIPERYGTGITIGFSTTGCFSLTASSTAFIRGTFQ